MSSDQIIHQSSPTAPIKTPDQLQQAQRPDAPRPAGDVDQARETGAVPPPQDGILGQLETERAHD